MNRLPLRPPTWPALPRRRRVRLDAAHGLQAPHPMLLAALVRGRLGAAAYRVAEFTRSALTGPAVLDRVA